MEPLGINWGFLLAQIINFILFIAVIVGVVVLVRRLLRRSSDTPLDILKGRLARGEIDSDEYERLRALIRDDGAMKPKRVDAREDEDITVDAVEYEQIRSVVNRRRLNDDDR